MAESAKWTMYKSLLIFLPGFLCPIIAGSLGDIYGRRLLFIIPCIGSILSVGVFMVIIHFDLPLWVLLIAHLINSCFGVGGVIFTGVCAFIADTVPPRKRAWRIACVDFVSLTNAAIANLFVGYWIRAQGFFNPLIFVLCGKSLSLLYAIFLVPETLKRDEVQRRPRLTLKNSVRAVNLCLYDNGTGRRWKLNILFATFAVARLVTTMSVMTLYQMNNPLCWGSVEIAYFALINVLVQCFVMLIMSAVPDRWMSAEVKVVLSRASLVGSSLCTVFAVTPFIMYLGEAMMASSNGNIFRVTGL